MVGVNHKFSYDKQATAERQTRSLLHLVSKALCSRDYRDEIHGCISVAGGRMPGMAVFRAYFARVMARISPSIKKL